MSIHLVPPRTIFMQVEANEGFDPQRDFTRALALHPVVQAWDDLMHGELLKRLPGNDTGLNWLRLAPIFDWTALGIVQTVKAFRKQCLLFPSRLHDSHITCPLPT